MKKPIIEFKNVSKVFEDSGTVVLKNINFELEEGKFYTLLGASGSGKSTILMGNGLMMSQPTNGMSTPSFNPMPYFHT